MANKSFLKENSFEGSPGGVGVSNYGNTYGTPGGGNNTQDPGRFSSSDKTVNHMNNQSSSSSFDNTEKKVTSLSPDTTPSKVDIDTSKTLDPSNSYEKEVDQIFKKKITPSPDDLLSALQYELGNMTHKDKTIAKQNVLKNMKKDPMYYTRLHMLNIDDDAMMNNMDENFKKLSVYERTKYVVDNLIKERQTKAVVDENINNILDQIKKEKQNKHS